MTTPFDDLLARATDSGPVLTQPPASQVRARAERRRTVRRTAAAGVLTLAVVAGVAIGANGSPWLVTTPTPPATPLATPSPTPTTTPSRSTPSVRSTPPAPITAARTEPTDRPDLSTFRFIVEDAWDAEGADFPSITEAGVRGWVTERCDSGTGAGGAKAMRTVTKPDAHVGSARQVATFDSAASASAAMAALRTDLRTCQAELTGQLPVPQGPWVTEFAGGQLDTGDESFWTATRDVDPGSSAEMSPSFTDLIVVVRSASLILVASAPAVTDEGLCEHPGQPARRGRGDPTATGAAPAPLTRPGAPGSH